MDTPVKTPWTEWVGTSRTTITDGWTPNIDVYVPEFIPDVEGDPALVIDQAVGQPSMWQDPGGAHMIHIKRVITATYLGGTNHIVPSIHMGERVRLLSYAGNEQYYWLPLGRDPGIRLHERIRWFAMSQPASVEPQTYEEVTDLNSYFIDFNTNPGSKQWHLHTSDADGEPVIYDWYIWPDLGEMLFTDNWDNWFHLWTFEPIWWLHNNRDANVVLDHGDIKIYCPDNILIKAGKNITVLAGESYYRNAPTHVITGDDYANLMDFTISHETGLQSVTADGIIRVGDLNWTGNWVTGGGGHVNGMESHVCADPLACW